MVNNLEHLSDEEAPNSAASDWDVLSGEKSIEEREYEQNEHSLQDELYSTVDGRVNTISNVGQELCSIMKDADHPFSNLHCLVAFDLRYRPQWKAHHVLLSL